jgi:transcriptional regulator with XRE-family HTH domain
VGVVGEGVGVNLREALVRLRWARVEQGLRQGDVARLMHMSQSVVSKLETADPGNRPLRLLEVYADVLGFELRVELVRKEGSGDGETTSE